MRLYDFFKENLEREPVPVIDFHVRAERIQPGMIHFYIHPAYVDGITLDFVVTSTGALTPMGEVPPTVWDEGAENGGEKVSQR